MPNKFILNLPIGDSHEPSATVVTRSGIDLLVRATEWPENKGAFINMAACSQDEYDHILAQEVKEMRYYQASLKNPIKDELEQSKEVCFS